MRSRAGFLWEICFMRCDLTKEGHQGPQRERLPGSDSPSLLRVVSPTAMRKAKRCSTTSSTSYLRQVRDFYSSIPGSSDTIPSDCFGTSNSELRRGMYLWIHGFSPTSSFCVVRRHVIVHLVSLMISTLSSPSVAAEKCSTGSY